MQNSFLNVIVRSSSQASHYLKIWQNDERVLSAEDGDLATQDSIIILLRLFEFPFRQPIEGSTRRISAVWLRTQPESSLIVLDVSPSISRWDVGCLSKPATPPR